MLDKLKKEAQRIGKPEWRSMLKYVAELHEKSIHPAGGPFPRPWEEIGPGYCAGAAFGHWDIVHQILDVLAVEPDHARDQIINNLANQTQDGLIPGSIWMRDENPRWNTKAGHPPVWPVAVHDHYELTGSIELIKHCFEPLMRQIGWFEKARKTEGIGYYYLDILDHTWESGVDEGVRFDNVQTGPYACVDATSHIYWLYDHAAQWANLLNEDSSPFEAMCEELRGFIQDKLFDEETGFFHDIWAVGHPEHRHFNYEGMWPVVVGAATQKQAQRVIDESLLNPDRFLTYHPIATVARTDPAFEARLWRGPAWNSMTLWAARGCMRWNRPDAAARILEMALDASTRQFEITGKIWEFYHSLGDAPTTVARKPHTQYNHPCPDYLGHNPLIAMARLWESTNAIKVDISASGCILTR